MEDREKKTETILVRLPAEEKQAAEAAANKEHRSLSNLVRWLLGRYVSGEVLK
jgi:hypothetical protein